jgi:beta-phosphoglucomutase-like phosphatase (HAD superfamily)
VLLHGGPAGLLDRWRAQHGYDRFLGSTVTAGALGIRRDAPSLYLRIAADASLSPDRCLLANDERAPFEAAREAGMGAYRFGTVYGLRAVLNEPARAFSLVR